MMIEMFWAALLRSAMENYVDKTGRNLCAVYREFNLKYHDELIKPFPGVKENIVCFAAA